MSKSDLVDLGVVLHIRPTVDHKLEKATWLPKSVIELEPLPRSKRYMLTLPERMAVDKASSDDPRRSYLDRPRLSGCRGVLRRPRRARRHPIKRRRLARSTSPAWSIPT